ncbi:MAG: hypothetical protein GY753_13345 [Gammaproteobacteria bacterium]|nr:hypothetical protein [Gammaproteobacteria bacterium]
METRHQLTAVGTTGYLQLPARFQGMRSVRLDGDYVDYLPSTYMDASGEYTDSTCYWTIEADQLRILPQLSVGDEVEIVVYQGFAPLSDSNTTNWWMDNAADLLLYGALVEAEPFLKNDDRIVTWAGLFDRGIAKLVAADTNDRVGNNLVIRCG